MMNAIQRQIREPVTYQDVLNAPPNMVAELTGGRLHLQPRPAMRHAFASSAIDAMFGAPL